MTDNNTGQRANRPTGQRGGPTGHLIAFEGLDQSGKQTQAERLLAAVSDLHVNGRDGERAPHVLNLSVAGADSEALLMHLDLAGVAASSGSACTTGAVEPSHVLLAMGVPRELALGAIRFSLGRESTAADVDRVVEVMPSVVAKVRKLAGVLGRA